MRAAEAGFKRLAAYIFGGNRAGQDIAMTAPVVQQQDGVSIVDMTAPVLQEPGDGEWTMAFVMPSGYTLETLPQTGWILTSSWRQWVPGRSLPSVTQVL